MITTDQPATSKVPLGLSLKLPDPREATLICKRLHGGSVGLCGCRLPLGADGKGGWLECPPQARRVLPKQAAVKVAVERQVTGDICHSCGGPNMMRAGTCLVCRDCGDSSGGCS